MNAGFYRTMGSLWVLVPLLLVVCVLPNLASSLKMVCPLYGDVYLRKYEKMLFSPGDESAMIKIRSEPCNLTYTYLVNVSEVLGNNTDLKDYRGQQWYEISYSIVETLLQLRLVGNTTININRTWEPFRTCNLTNGIKFSFDSLTVLGKDCSDNSRAFHLPDITLLSDLNTDFGGTRYDYGGSYSRQHVIFIPVGAFLFLISVCCRCWYRRKRTLQPVRTITVARSISTTDVCNTENDLDLPPAYADIQNEMAPPPYSEIEKLSVPPTEISPTELTSTSAEIPLAQQSCEEETTDDCNKYLVNSDPSSAGSAADSSREESNSASTLPRMLSSCGRTLQTQFSFKPLHEEE